MIVKNEENCISKCLNSVKPYIDHWIICDTGSTDNTTQVIQELMSDVPGEILHHEWKDFSTNRNLGIAESKNKADYTLIIDADDHLIVEDENAFNNLDKDYYKLKIKHGNLEYYRPQLLKNSIDFKYKGVLHEYIDVQSNSYSNLEGCYIQTSFSGGRSKNPNKFQDDAKVFEEALKLDPNNSRYVFYLAQSYRDYGNLTKAIENYDKRALMGGWIEETFISLFESAKCKEKLMFPMFDIETSYLKAYYCNPLRAEPLYSLSKYFRLNNNLNKAYCYAKEGLKINKPKEGLFIQNDCYEWRLYDELAISSFYMGHKDEGKLSCEKILDLPNIPPQDKLRIVKNYSFY